MGEPPRMCACTLYFQTLESLAYIFVANSMGLSVPKFVQWAPNDASACTRVRFCISRSFKPQGHWSIEGRWFWYQSIVRMRLWSYFTPFLRYLDLLAKNCLFFLPLPYSAPCLPMFPLEFCGEVIKFKVNREETGVMELSIPKWRPHDRWV